MLKSIDPYLDRVKKQDYNCFDFVREVWLGMTGEDIANRVKGLLGEVKARRGRLSDLREFKRLEQPVSPCFVVFQRFKFVPHLGIYLNGRILHLTDRGVQYMPLEVARQYFIGVKYYQ